MLQAKGCKIKDELGVKRWKWIGKLKENAGAVRNDRKNTWNEIFVVEKKQENKEDSLRLLFLERICLPNAQRL